MRFASDAPSSSKPWTSAEDVPVERLAVADARDEVEAVSGLAELLEVDDALPLSAWLSWFSAAVRLLTSWLIVRPGVEVVERPVVVVVEDELVRGWADWLAVVVLVEVEAAPDVPLEVEDKSALIV